MENKLSDSQIRSTMAEHGSPLYIYSLKALKAQADSALTFLSPYGCTVRYAMKANPHPKFLRTLHQKGLKIDTSSGGEVNRALEAGIPAADITLNSQEIPDDLDSLLKKGVRFVATSLHQLETFGKLANGSSLGVRINPGLGSGVNNRMTTGGVNAGFGIWYEYLPKVNEIAEKYNLHIDLLHTHIGSGTDPAAWQQTARITLELLNELPMATTVSFGGGFKTGRMPDEPTADMAAIGTHISELITSFADDTGRRMYVEIEPGTFLAAHAGWLVAKVTDITDTGSDGHTFLRINTGMNDILRFSMYGAQHSMKILPAKDRETNTVHEYMVVGHCCESSDIMTPEKGDPESISPRSLSEAQIGDFLIINSCGAYCATMRAIDYNSFIPAKEVCIDE